MKVVKMDDHIARLEEDWGETLWEDRIVWQRGKQLPDGTIRVVTMTRATRRRLLEEHGRAWVREYLRLAEAELAKWGVH